MFLSADELVELTGYRQKSKQVAHLKSARIPFHVNRGGHPKVAKAVLEGRKDTSQQAPKAWSPSWAGNQQ